MKFNDKVAIVTGGAQGIGKAYTLALLELGMKVCVCDIDNDSINEFMNSVPDTKANDVIFHKADVTSISEFRGVFDKVISTFSRIDVVVNNAAVFNEHNWKKMVDVNFIGVIHGIKLAFEYMDIKNNGNGGFVINTASNAGLVPFELGPVYSGCKHAVVGLTKSYGTDFHLKKTGITVNALCPGPVDTALFRTFPEMSLCKETATVHNDDVTPIKPEKVAEALVKLLHDNKNGALLKVDDNGMSYVT